MQLSQATHTRQLYPCHCPCHYCHASRCEGWGCLASGYKSVGRFTPGKEPPQVFNPRIRKKNNTSWKPHTNKSHTSLIFPAHASCYRCARFSRWLGLLSPSHRYNLLRLRARYWLRGGKRTQPPRMFQSFDVAFARRFKTQPPTRMRRADSTNLSKGEIQCELHTSSTSPARALF